MVVAAVALDEAGPFAELGEEGLLIGLEGEEGGVGGVVGGVGEGGVGRRGGHGCWWDWGCEGALLFGVEDWARMYGAPEVL